MTASAQAILEQHAGSIEQYLRTRLHQGAGAEAPPVLLKAIEYSLLAGGKRLRPALLLEAFAALSRDNASPTPLPAAAAIELVHTFSLVHDDLPAMDDDDLRRGQPTSHKVFGEAIAILAGDAMLTLAFEWLAADYAKQPDMAVALVCELAGATGPGAMIGGQAQDISAQGQAISIDSLRQVHEHKTGALLTCACRMGAILARADKPAFEAITQYGRHLGLAFQIADDLLDVTAAPEGVGKRTGKDSAAGKNTFPALLGADGARSAAQQECAAAIEAVAGLGPRAQGLRTLARFTIQRAK